MALSSPSAFGRMSSLHGLADTSLKDLIAWGDNFKVNQPQIDAQHEAIFKLVIELGTLWHEHGNSDQLLAIVKRLQRIVREHFHYEEAMLVRVGYPKLAAHKAEHAVLLRDLESILERVEAMDHGPAYSEPGWEVMKFLLGLTVGHIVQSDVDYCRYARDTSIDLEMPSAPS